MHVTQQISAGMRVVTLHGVQHVSTHTNGADCVTLMLTPGEYERLAGQLNPTPAERGPLDLMLRYANQ